MGKISQGILGSVSNKVGNVVGRVRYGENILAIYQPKVANPRTLEQNVQRSKFSIAMKACKIMSVVNRQWFKPLKRGQTYFNAAMSDVMNNAITGAYPNQLIGLNHLPVSNGSVAMVYNPQMAFEEGALQFMWTDNSGIGDAEMNDNIRVCAVMADGLDANTGIPTEIIQNLLGPRNSRTGSLAIPAEWADKYVHVYMWATRGAETGENKYLGCVQLHEA